MRVASPRGHVFVAGQRAAFPPNRFFVHRFHHVRPFFFGGTCLSAFGCSPFFSSSFVGGYPFYPFDYPYETQQPQVQPAVYTDDSNSRELSLEVQRLSDEIAVLRDEEHMRDQERNSPATQAVSKPAPSDDGHATVLIFRDGHQLTVQNYAIAGNTLWVVTEHNARKISVADLDVQATQDANSKNGVDFRLPSSAQKP